MDRIPGQIDTSRSPEWSKKPPSALHPLLIQSLPLPSPPSSSSPSHLHVLLRWLVINLYRHGHRGFRGCGVQGGHWEGRVMRTMGGDGWGGGLAATQTWRRFLLMHRKLFPPHRQCLPGGCYCQLTACKVVSPSLTVSLCVDLSLSLRLSLLLSVKMGYGSWRTLWCRIKAWEQNLMEFATLPIIQMILNANYPPRLCREWPVTQDAARVCRALRRR